MTTQRQLELSVLAPEFAVCRLAADAEVPAWLRGSSLLSVTRTAAELSVVCEASLVPDDVVAERGWRCSA